MIKKAEHITSRDVAKLLNVENEYLEIFFESELEKTYNNFMNDEVNNIIISVEENDKINQ